MQGKAASKPRHQGRPDDAIEFVAATGTPRRSAFDVQIGVLNRTISYLNTITTTNNKLKEYIVGLSNAAKTLARYSPTQVDVPLPDWIDCDLWDFYMVLRGKKGKAVTARGAELLIKRLEKLRADGHDPKEVIEQTLANGWQNFFPIQADTPPKEKRRDYKAEERESDFLTNKGNGYLTEEEYMKLYGGDA